MQIVDQRLCDWVEVSIPPLNDLLIYRKQPLQTLYTPLLGILTEVPLTDFWKIPLHQVSNTDHKWPSFQLSFPVLSSAIFPKPDCSCSHAHLPQLTRNDYSITHSQWNLLCKPPDFEPSLLLSFMGLCIEVQLSFRLWLNFTYMSVHTMCLSGSVLSHSEWYFQLPSTLWKVYWCPCF